jgi:hypothetical protein
VWGSLEPVTLLEVKYFVRADLALGSIFQQDYELVASGFDHHLLAGDLRRLELQRRIVDVEHVGLRLHDLSLNPLIR